MVQIDRLVLGTEIENLLVEVFSLEGIDEASKPEDPAHKAIVGDATGQVRLVYRASTACRPTQVKKGKTYLVTGRFLFAESLSVELHRRSLMLISNQNL